VKCWSLAETACFLKLESVLHVARSAEQRRADCKLQQASVDTCMNLLKRQHFPEVTGTVLDSRTSLESKMSRARQGTPHRASPCSLIPGLCCDQLCIACFWLTDVVQGIGSGRSVGRCRTLGGTRGIQTGTLGRLPPGHTRWQRRRRRLARRRPVQSR